MEEEIILFDEGPYEKNFTPRGEDSLDEKINVIRDNVEINRNRILSIDLKSLDTKTSVVIPALKLDVLTPNAQLGGPYESSDIEREAKIMIDTDSECPTISRNGE
jgi:hypothetical protein